MKIHLILNNTDADLKFVINDTDIIDFVESIPNRQRRRIIKTIIRRHLYENYSSKYEKKNLKPIYRVKVRKVFKV